VIFFLIINQESQCNKILYQSFMMIVMFSIADITITAIHRGSNRLQEPMRHTIYVLMYSCIFLFRH